MHTSVGFFHFLNQSGHVSHALLLLLLLMSVTTWYLIASKFLLLRNMRRHSRLFLNVFWQSEDINQVGQHLQQQGVRDPFSHLAHHGLRAVEQYRGKTGRRLIDAGSADEFLTRALRRAIEQDTARLEYGQTMLASIASSAPFIGLFGTVWGIYHALIAISLSGQSTLDKVAAPVGEALIMTAIGLAVAIPATLAYNAFTRANRLVLSELDGFAHDLFGFMATGQRMDNSDRPSSLPVSDISTARAA